VLDLVAATLAVALAGGPGDAVATVDGDPIEKRTYLHWRRVAARSGRQSQAQSRRQALQLLISAKWIEHEAAERGIVVSDEEVRRSFEHQKAQAFPKERDYRKFLRDTGRSEADILFQIRFELLSNGIREQVVAGVAPVTDSQIADYYNRHRKRFADPERRDLRLVLTKRRTDAQRAKRALRSGRSWRAVTKRFSIDPGTRRRGGRLDGLSKGAGVPELNRVAFKARKGQLVGPVKSQFGYYVFEVTKITPARQRSLEEAKPTIRRLLESENQQRAIDAFVKSFKAKWKARTECRPGYVVRECRTGGG
jgi:foldase protein PrsA